MGAREAASLSPDGSVTHQISKLKAGDHTAAVLLWRRYFQRLVVVARRRLPAAVRRAADEEDVALNAFARFCSHAEQGRLPKVRNRDDLWQLLVTLTVRMAIDELRREGRKKRGGAGNDVRVDTDPEQVASRQPDPGFVAQIAEECDRLLGSLDDETLKAIAVWKTEGYTNEDIAGKLGVVLRTVERKLWAIRKRLAGDNQAVVPGQDGPSH
jgi:DNA-directed RNA polymerase specialized sigma24 family protein